MASSSLKRGFKPMEEELLLKEMHMKNSITITPSKPNSKYGNNKKSVEPVRLTPAWEGKNLPNDILNFKAVTMERADLETNPPKDRYLAVYFILLIHGIGILMPWNMFITAKDYFEQYKLDNATTNPNIDTTFYVTYFMTFLCVFGQLPNVIFNWINIFLNFGGSLTSRIVYSIVLEVIIFIFTETMVLIDSSGWPHIFFWATMGSVFFLNVVNGIYQNTIYGLAARLPPAYTNAVILGSNISGIFTSIVSMGSKFISPNRRTAAVYYFLIALFVLFICFDTYFVLPLTKFYKYHNLQFEKAHEKTLLATEETEVKKKKSYWQIFKTCSLQCFNTFYIFLITLTIFPAMQSNIKSNNLESFIVDSSYFVDITCFLTFNVFATLGNLLSTVIIWPGPKKLHILVLLRTIFVPLMLFCNYKVDGRILPIYINNDYVYWATSAIFALTGGYFSSLSMMYCAKTVAPEYSSTAGMFGAASLVTGIFAGVLLAFVWPVVVKSVMW